jgi:oxygen-independent coproporphyrinogen III oxidase
MPGVYISFPFCSQKCTYCNFASGVFPKSLEPGYIEALHTEIANHHWRFTPDTVYLGGGTPSQMDLQALDSILSCIPWRPWKEATLEAAPGTVSHDRATAWRRSGINRVSLGVQSFVDAELRRTGRKHTASIVEQEVAILRECGIEDFNLDLIAGLPGQTAASWRESLDWIEKLNPPHVSVYMLEVDEDSRLGNEILKGGGRYGAHDVPTDELIAQFYEQATARLEQLGIRRYEISNYARRGSRSLHNMKYWKLEPYAGFGADAHSFDGNMRSQNVESASEYVRLIEEQGTAVSARLEANPLEERFFVGLRMMDGIRPEPSEWERFREPIKRFIGEGLLEYDGGNLRLTPQGVLLSNEVFAEFVL